LTTDPVAGSPGEVAPAPGPAAGAPHRTTPGGPARWARWQPAFVVLLVLVLATAVALVLAQSAGAISVPLLGGTGASGAGLLFPRP